MAGHLGGESAVLHSRRIGHSARRAIFSASLGVCRVPHPCAFFPAQGWETKNPNPLRSRTSWKLFTVRCSPDAPPLRLPYAEAALQMLKQKTLGKLKKKGDLPFRPACYYDLNAHNEEKRVEKLRGLSVSLHRSPAGQRIGASYQPRHTMRARRKGAITSGLVQIRVPHRAHRSKRRHEGATLSSSMKRTWPPP